MSDFSSRVEQLATARRRRQEIAAKHRMIRDERRQENRMQGTALSFFLVGCVFLAFAAANHRTWMGGLPLCVVAVFFDMLRRRHRRAAEKLQAEMMELIRTWFDDGNNANR